MLYSVVLFCTLTVVEAVKCTNKIACDSAYPVECDVVGMFFSTAARTSLADDTCVAATRITVYRVIDSTVAYS